LNNLGYEVYDQIKQHDKAIVLGGYLENPNVFSNPIVFYIMTHKHVHEFMIQILKEYYDTMIDLTGLSIKESVELITIEHTRQRL